MYPVLVAGLAILCEDPVADILDPLDLVPELVRGQLLRATDILFQSIDVRDGPRVRGWVTNPAVACLWPVGLHTPDRLSDIQAARFAMYFRAVFNQYIRVYALYETGLGA